jgi:antitoxin component YwqK of YwqJK toxin-antitoxin module
MNNNISNLCSKDFVRRAIVRTCANYLENRRECGTVTSMHKEKRMVATKKKRRFRDGYWKEYNKSAVLISEGSYLNNVKHGIWNEYYDSGELMIEEHYVHGIKHGRFRTFHRNGNVMSDGIFQNGRCEGFFKAYDENGKIIRKVLFVNDKEVAGVEEKITQ